MSADPFRLKKVCANCPFRSDKLFTGLTPSRVTEIAESIRDGSVFHCHATLDYDRLDDEDRSSPVVEKSQFCAGALATMEKGDEPNQAVRIGERLGLYDPQEFDWETQPVYEGIDAWKTALIERNTTQAE